MYQGAVPALNAIDASPDSDPCPSNRPELPDPPCMANPPVTPRELVDRLDSRHDELIAKLDELNAQIEAALAQFGRPKDEGQAETPPGKKAA